MKLQYPFEQTNMAEEGTDELKVGGKGGRVRGEVEVISCGLWYHQINHLLDGHLNNQVNPLIPQWMLNPFESYS